MTCPQFSVLIPTKDAGNTLEEAIQSIQRQSMSDWEMILVDDHSTDHSPELMKQAAEQDKRIRVTQNPGNGIVDALNWGLQQVQSNWVVRMDSDDISLPPRLEHTLQWIHKFPDTQVFSCLVEGFPAVTDGMAAYLSWLNELTSPDHIARDIYVESPIAHPSAIVSTQAMRSIGGYRDGDFPEDYDLWLRLHQAGCLFRKVPEVLFQWRESPQRLSRTDARYRLEAFRGLKAQHLVNEHLTHGRTVQIWGAGAEGKKWAKLLQSLHIHVERFFDIDPKKVGGRVGGKTPVLHWTELRNHQANTITLGAVGAKGARLKMRNALADLGLIETENFIFVQ
jgi:glycosyltransferase involved in cell wall biosynthesis